MKTITKAINLYNYDELSTESKEKVKSFLLNDELKNELFYENIVDELGAMFPDSSLNIQYSLGCSQGDGLNIYGSLKAHELLDKLSSNFDNKEFRRLEHYLSESLYLYYLPYNRRYCYCMASSIDIDGIIIGALEDARYKNIDYKLIERFNTLIKSYISDLCSDYERRGYDYLYNISDEEVSEEAAANEWLFTEDGAIYHE